MKKIDVRNLIVKSNKLVEANYRLTAGEQKVILKLISSIHKDDVDFKKYRFKIAEFIQLMDVNNPRKYTEIKKITYDLLGKKISIYDESEKKLIQVTWLASAVYFEGRGEVELCFAPDLKPYLLQLKDAFTQFTINNIMQLRSGYSARIYELLKQYEKIGERVLEIFDIRKKLGIEDKEYKLYADFKRYVILQAQKEINSKTDIEFNFEEIKGYKRKVTTIKFIIKPKSNSRFFDEQSTIDDIQLNLEVKDIIKQFKNLYGGNLDIKLTQKMFDEKGIDHIKNCLIEYVNYIQGRTIENIAGDFYTFVMKGYVKPVKTKNIVKPDNMINFEQRKYSDEEFESLYSNVVK
jgi:plasmid replication initiation protein